MGAMKLVDQQHPFYQPLWRRIAITITIVLWTGFEIFIAGDPLWLVLSSALLVYSIWVFFVTWPKPPPQ